MTAGRPPPGPGRSPRRRSRGPAQMLREGARGIAIVVVMTAIVLAAGGAIALTVDLVF